MSSAKSFERRSFYARAGKRFVDVACSLVGLVAVSPLMLIVAAAVKLTTEGPVLFRQVRVGQFGKEFRILKFRTMRPQSPDGASLLTASGDSRITRVGKYLRKAKIDELPQLINVLAGEMSLVGPRPEVPHYVASYSPAQKSVLDVKPGITGLSTHQFRNEEELLAERTDKESFYLTTILPTKIAIDLTYCQKITFGNDAKLIFATLAAVFGLGSNRSQQTLRNFRTSSE